MLVGGGCGDAVGVLVGVGVAVQVAIARGTALRVSVQPLSKWATTPKSELTTPVNPSIVNSSIKRQAATPNSG